MKVRLLIVAVFALFLAAVGAIATYRAILNRPDVETREVPPAPVRCMALERQQFELTESFYGVLRANVRVDMAFQVAGRIERLSDKPDLQLKEGDRVQKDQLLAQLEQGRFEAALAQALAEMSRARASMHSADAQVREAEARRDDAMREHRRLVELLENNATTVREVERAETAMEVAHAAYQSATSMREAAANAFAAAEMAAQVARVNLQDSMLLAPMDALIADAPAEVGQYVAPGERIFTLVDNSRVKLVIGVVERKLPLVKPGQAVRVYIAALGAGRYGSSGSQGADATMRMGTVTRVPPAADAITGLFNVEIQLANDDGALVPGMVGQALITVREVTAVAIPAEAAVRVGDRVRAFFLPEGQSQVRELELEPVAFQRDAYIVADLPADVGRLVVEGQSRLTDGQAVRVLE